MVGKNGQSGRPKKGQELTDEQRAKRKEERKAYFRGYAKQYALAHKVEMAVHQKRYQDKKKSLRLREQNEPFVPLPPKQDITHYDIMQAVPEKAVLMVNAVIVGRLNLLSWRDTGDGHTVHGNL